MKFRGALSGVQEVSDDVIAEEWEPLLNNLGNVYRKLRSLPKLRNYGILAYGTIHYPHWNTCKCAMVHHLTVLNHLFLLSLRLVENQNGTSPILT